jgi:hypothetical protein
MAHEDQIMTELVTDGPAIAGWGVDADPMNNPTYPMRHVEQQRTRGFTWDRPVVQTRDVEVLRSIEHNRMPAVHGTSTPPSGLSGMIRRVAFKRSENDWWHWLLLMGADRVNVVEGVIEDLARGKVPNIPAEMGARAEWRHNRTGMLAKGAAAAGIAALMFAASRWRQGPDEQSTPQTIPDEAGTSEALV